MSTAAGRRSGRRAQAGSVAELAAAAPLRRRFRQAQLVMGRALAGYRLSVLQYHLLLEVGVAGRGGLGQGRLVELVVCPEARVSALVHELEGRGLLTRYHSEPDRRSVQLRLTRRGLRTVVEAQRVQRKALSDMVRAIPPEELRAMAEWGMRTYLEYDT